MRFHWPAIRLGLARGATEFRHGLTTQPDVWVYLALPVMFLVPMWFIRDAELDQAGLPLVALALPGIIGLLVAYGGLVSPAAGLAIEREDGTLLRAKALPRGIEAYLVGLTLRSVLEVTCMVALTLVPAMLLFDGVAPAGLTGWLTMLAVMLLGLLATLPLGLVIGSLAKSPRSVGGVGFLGTGALVAISGIFYPVTALVGWLQGLAQVFPLYWLGLGMRSAFLPDSATAVEIGGSWRSPLMIAVLAGWGVLGLVLAPMVLRRMARRESGADLHARRDAVLRRV